MNGVTDITGSFSPATITGAGSSTLTISVTGATVSGLRSRFLSPSPRPAAVYSQSIQVIVHVTTVGQIAAPGFSAAGRNVFHAPDRDGSQGDQNIFNYPGLVRFTHYTARRHHPYRKLPRLRQSDHYRFDDDAEGDRYRHFWRSEPGFQRNVHHRPGRRHPHLFAAPLGDHHLGAIRPPSPTPRREQPFTTPPTAALQPRAQPLTRARLPFRPPKRCRPLPAPAAMPPVPSPLLPILSLRPPPLPSSSPGGGAYSSPQSVT